MIYEIVIRPSYNKIMTSDHLIWVESDLPSRAFEKWLKSKSLLDGTSRAPLVRWGIAQTHKSAHFDLASQESQLNERITELMSGAAHLMNLPLVTEASPTVQIAA